MKKYQLKNIDCASCAAKIEDGVSKLKEVNFVSVNFANSSITLDTGNLDLVKKKIKEIEPEVELTEVNSAENLISKNEIAENKSAIIKAASALMLLLLGLYFREDLHKSQYWIFEYIIFVSAYLISGWKVIAGAFRNIVKGKIFDEQFLMTIATLGAFAIHEMPEGVAVMLFYVVGELFQDIAVNRSRKSIKSLLEKINKTDFRIADDLIVKAIEKCGE